MNENFTKICRNLDKKSEITTDFSIKSCRNLDFFVTLRQVSLIWDKYEGEYYRQRTRDWKAWKLYFKPQIRICSHEEADEDLKRGTQIDLLIDRSDKSISICEMKFCNGEYEITKAYDAHLHTVWRFSRKWRRQRKRSFLHLSHHMVYIIICMQERSTDR